MKLNVKGLVFVGFAAAVFASAANAATGDEKKVTSLAYTDATYQKKLTAGTGIGIDNNTISVNGDITAYTGTAPVVVDGHEISVNTTGGVAEDGLNLVTGGQVYSYVAGELANYDTNGEANVIETVKVNGSALTPDNDKAVDVTVPVLGVQRNGTDLTPDSTTKKVNVEVPVLGVTLNGTAVTPTNGIVAVTDHTYSGDTNTIAVANDGTISAVTTGGVANNGNNLVTGDQVYDYVAGLNIPTGSTIVTHTGKVGDTNQGVYVAADGTVTAMTHTVDSDVPANAVFTDTTYTADGTTITLSNGQFSATAGSIANGNTGLVNGGQVYTAINGKTFEPSTTGCTSYPCALVMTAAGTYGWETIAQPSNN